MEIKGRTLGEVQQFIPRGVGGVGEEKKRKRQCNTSAGLYKHYTMCPCRWERGPGQAVKIIGED